MFDTISDYIPFWSSITNTFDLLFKACIYADKEKEEVQACLDKYKIYLSRKTVVRCIVLIFFPIAGNLAFLVYDTITHCVPKVPQKQNDSMQRVEIIREEVVLLRRLNEVGERLKIGTWIYKNEYFVLNCFLERDSGLAESMRDRVNKEIASFGLKSYVVIRSDRGESLRIDP